MSKNIDQPHLDGLRPQTKLIRAGVNRSQHGETSEALYLNSGFVYDSAEQSEARFKGEDAGFIYSRYGNPTVAMFEERLATLEDAEVCFATASGMSAVFAALACQLNAGDKLVAARVHTGFCLGEVHCMEFISHCAIRRVRCTPNFYYWRKSPA